MDERPGPRCVAVIGNAGTVNSTLARSLAACLGLRYVDRDALVRRPGRTALSRAQRPAAFDAATRDPGWTYDGHRAPRPAWVRGSPADGALCRAATIRATACVERA